MVFTRILILCQPLSPDRMHPGNTLASPGSYSVSRCKGCKGPFKTQAPPIPLCFSPVVPLKGEAGRFLSLAFALSPSLPFSFFPFPLSQINSILKLCLHGVFSHPLQFGPMSLRPTSKVSSLALTHKVPSYNSGKIVT